MAFVGRDMAEAMLREILDARAAGRNATLIVPVGPADQFPILAQMINQQRIDCHNVVFINMDEYLTDEDRYVSADPPLSFRGFMDRLFYSQVDAALVPLPEHRVFPDPQQPDRIARLIEDRGGVGVCFGGIGINGHIAFNEPPEPGVTMTAEQFAALPTRALSLTRETRTINSVTVGGEIAVIPRRAVTVGMAECLGAMEVYADEQSKSFVHSVGPADAVTIPLLNYHPVFSQSEELHFLWCIAGNRYRVGDRKKEFMSAAVDKLTT